MWRSLTALAKIAASLAKPGNNCTLRRSALIGVKGPGFGEREAIESRSYRRRLLENPPKKSSTLRGNHSFVTYFIILLRKK
jgi:hypothetical protein